MPVIYHGLQKEGGGGGKHGDDMIFCNKKAGGVGGVGGWGEPILPSFLPAFLRSFLSSSFLPPFLPLAVAGMGCLGVTVFFEPLSFYHV